MSAIFLLSLDRSCKEVPVASSTILKPTARSARKLEAGLKLRYANGTEEDVRFTSRDELLRFFNDMKSNWENGRGFVDFRGKSVPVDEQFVSALSEQVTRLSPKHCCS